MPPTYDSPSSSNDPADVCLMLRARAEELWLRGQVLPVVRELEPPRTVAEEIVGAALAYLEVLWVDASARAAETDAALRTLLAQDARGEELLYNEARRLHAAVRAQRSAVERRVRRLTHPPLAAWARERAVI